MICKIILRTYVPSVPRLIYKFEEQETMSLDTTNTFHFYSGWAFLCFSRMRGGGGGGQKAPVPKICHTYPTVMKLGTVIPKKDPKDI